MKKHLMLSLSVIIALLVIVAAPSQPAQAQTETTTVGVRLVHALPGAGAVDIYIDDNLVVPNADFGDATPHLNIQQGNHNIDLRLAGDAPSADPVYSQSLNLIQPRAGVALSLIVHPTTSNTPTIFVSEDDLNPATVGQARIHVIHVVPEIGTVDVKTNNNGPIASGISFATNSGTVNPPVNNYDLVVVPAGGTPDEALLDIGQVNVNTGMLYKFVVAGSGDSAEVMTFMTPLAPSTTQPAVLTRVAHGSPDAPTVDIYANDIKILVNIAPGEATPHIALPAGDISLSVRPAGAVPNSEPAATANINLSSSTGAASLVAVGTLNDSSFTFSVFEDNIDGMAGNVARVRVINTVVTGSATVSLGETIVANDLPIYSASDEVDLAVGTYDINAEIGSDDSAIAFEAPALRFNGGSYHTLLLFANASAGVNLSSTPIATDIGSLPGSVINDAVVMEPTSESNSNTSSSEDTSTTVSSDSSASGTGTTSEVTDSATNTTETDNTETTAPVESSTNTDTTSTDTTTASDTSSTDTTTTAVSANTTPASPPPTAAPRQGIDRTVRGQVNLNPGVNLQCREYPSADARSLGLIPNNTLLEIAGYAAAADPEVETPYIPVPEESISIFESLPRGSFNEEGLYQAGDYEDLEFADVWLSALWSAPDGNVIDCWARADFLILTYQDEFIRDLQTFFDLEGLDLPIPVIRPVPYNYAAAPVDVETAVTSPDPVTLTPSTPVVDRRALPIVGIVDVVGNGNLQCREYPSPSARSLGLIQNATQLEVVGYASSADPEITTPFVPVEEDTIAVFEQLPPETDTELAELAFSDVWLSSLFTNSDGITFDCWVRSDFLTLIYRDDTITDLADLFALDTEEDPFRIFRPIPYNDPATIVDSSAPPSQTTGAGSNTSNSGSTGNNTGAATGDVIGTVNIPQGSNLNMFETPSINGVQIRSLTAGASVVVIGRTADNAWLQIRYEALGEGTFVGWVSNVGNWISLPVDINTLPVTN